ncbi:MAG TPA: hypothetical protein VEZ90_04055, partial [Blastocatellia bacterium]|nr:hypothetical protein [Blastocatellia bacterium]
FALICCAGLLVGLLRRRIDWRIAVLLLLTLVLNLAVVIYINLTFGQPQGRYMFPSLAAAAVLCALGLESLPYSGKIAWVAGVGFMLLMNIYLLKSLVYPAYWPAPVSDVSTATAILRFSSTTDVAAGSDSAHFIITGANPRFDISTDTQTDQLYFFAFSIIGPQQVGPATGAVEFKFDRGPGTGLTLPFRWTGNGTSGSVYVPVFKSASWQGRVTSVSIKPFASPAEKYKGSILALSNPRLVGSVSQ